jgi:hypothetical protein
MEPSKEPPTEMGPPTETMGPPTKRLKTKRVLSDFYGKPNVDHYIMTLLSHIGMPSFSRERCYTYLSWDLQKINIERIPTAADQLQAIDEVFERHSGHNIVSMVKHAAEHGNPWTNDKEFSVRHGFTDHPILFRNAFVFANAERPRVGITYSQSIDCRTCGTQRECRVNVLHLVRYRKHKNMADDLTTKLIARQLKRKRAAQVI